VAKSVNRNNRIIPTSSSSAINQDGVTLAQEANTDPYAEVTNATRLVDTNYEEVAYKEALKRQPIPKVYKSDVKIDQTKISTISDNQRRLIDYEQGAASRKIITDHARLGETIVASATNRINTQTIPTNYTGYSIEFLTALRELSPSHEIFNRHGNIALEQQSNGLYSYMLGYFQDKQQADIFLKDYLIEKYPSANIVFYDNGKRGKKVSQRTTKTKPVFAPPR